MSSFIEINGRRIGPGSPTYIVAEISANHNQSYQRAIDLIKAAKRAGADAVKVQTYTPDSLTIDSKGDSFQIPAGNMWEGRTLYELYGQAYMSWEWQPKLNALANELGVALFSTPQDRDAVDFLAAMGTPAYKIASFEIVDLPLIAYVARQGKPIILSTGLATVAEIDDAVRAARNAGATEIALLKCTSAYPAPAEEVNLRTIPHMMSLFQVPVGLSDHTLGSAVPIAAVALGACIVEKHLTISRSLPSPDAAFSMEPDEFKTMVESIRTIEKALGTVNYEPTASEQTNRVFRRSLFVVKDMSAGDVFSEENVRVIRPGFGMPPRFLPDVLGRCAARDLARGTPLTWAHVAGRQGPSLDEKPRLM